MRSLQEMQRTTATANQPLPILPSSCCVPAVFKCQSRPACCVKRNSIASNLSVGGLRAGYTEGLPGGQAGVERKEMEQR